jgi:hypothetical protein
MWGLWCLSESPEPGTVLTLFAERGPAQEPLCPQDCGQTIDLHTGGNFTFRDLLLLTVGKTSHLFVTLWK